MLGVVFVVLQASAADAEACEGVQCGNATDSMAGTAMVPLPHVSGKRSIVKHIKYGFSKVAAVISSRPQAAPGKQVWGHCFQHP